MTDQPHGIGLGKALQAAASDTRITKDGYNAFHKYHFSSAEEILSKCRTALMQHDLWIVPAITETQTRERPTKGGTTVVTTVLMEFTIIDLKTGEGIKRPWAGSGEDPGDKGLRKAITDAVKSFLLTLTLAPQGEDIEASDRAQQAPQAHPAPAEAAPATVDLTQVAYGLAPAQLATVFQTVGIQLPPEPLSALARVPLQYEQQFRTALAHEHEQALT